MNLISNMRNDESVRIFNPPDVEIAACDLKHNPRLKSLSLETSYSNDAETVLKAVENKLLDHLEVSGDFLTIEIDANHLGRFWLLDSLFLTNLCFNNSEEAFYKGLKSRREHVTRIVEIRNRTSDGFFKERPEESKFQLRILNCKMNLDELLNGAFHRNALVSELDLCMMFFSKSRSKETSNKSQDNEQSHLVLAQLLRANRTVSVLKLTNCNLWRINEVAQALAGNRNSPLCELDLSDNEFGNEGVKALGEMLRNPSLQLRKLSLASCKITELAGMVEGLKSHQTLHQLCLEKNPLNHVADQALGAIFQANVSISEIDLSYCNLNKVEAFSKALQGNRFLEVLRLNHNPLKGSERDIAVVVKINSALKQLNLQGCGMELTSEFGLSLEANRSLSHLVLAENSFQNVMAVESFANAMRVNRSLTFLDVNRMGASNLSKFIEALEENPATKSCPSLTELNLEGDELGDVGGKALLKSLDSNRKLKNLDITGCGVPNLIWQEIIRKVDANASGEQERKDHANREVALGPRLSTATAEKLKNLSAKHEALAKRVNQVASLEAKIDRKSLELLKEYATQLPYMFEAAAKAQEKDYEAAQIAASPALSTYYQFFARLLTGTWIACQAINSGMAANDEKYISDYVGLGLKKIGSLVPGVDKVTSLVSDAISAWNYPDKKRAVQQMALLFPDLDTAFDQLGIIARRATLGQVKELEAFPSPSKDFVSKFKEFFRDAKTLLLFDDADTPLKRKAVEDCKLLLKGIKEGSLPGKPTLEDFLKVILGPKFKYSPIDLAAKNVANPIVDNAVRQSVSSGGPAPAGKSVEPSRQSVDVTSEIQRMKEQLAKLEEHLPKGNAAASGISEDGHMTEKLAGIEHHFEQVRGELAAVKRKHDRHWDDIQMDAENLSNLKKNKDSCVIA